MKRHINVLYGVVMILLIMQILTFVFVSTQFSKVTVQQNTMESDIENNFIDLKDKIDDVETEGQTNINLVATELAQQKTDVQSQISLIKSSQGDFSGIIEETIRGVVSVLTDRSAGTGFVINPDGYIVTNNHVIAGANIIRVSTFDGVSYDAIVIGFNPITDIALLQIPLNLKSLELKYSDDVEIGEKVIAIGNPLGLSFTVTEGIVSAVDRIGPSGLEAYIQTDVTLNPGNSGGPLINKEGKVIGINNFKIGGAESLGFALESDVIRDEVNMIANATLIS